MNNDRIVNWCLCEWVIRYGEFTLFVLVSWHIFGRNSQLNSRSHPSGSEFRGRACLLGRRTPRSFVRRAARLLRPLRNHEPGTRRAGFVRFGVESAAIPRSVRRRLTPVLPCASHHMWICGLNCDMRNAETPISLCLEPLATLSTDSTDLFISCERPPCLRCGVNHISALVRSSFLTLSTLFTSSTWPWTRGDYASHEVDWKFGVDIREENWKRARNSPLSYINISVERGAVSDVEVVCLVELTARLQDGRPGECSSPKQILFYHLVTVVN